MKMGQSVAWGKGVGEEMWKASFISVSLCNFSLLNMVSLRVPWSLLPHSAAYSSAFLAAAQSRQQKPVLAGLAGRALQFR